MTTRPHKNNRNWQKFWTGLFCQTQHDCNSILSIQIPHSCTWGMQRQETRRLTSMFTGTVFTLKSFHAWMPTVVQPYLLTVKANVNSVLTSLLVTNGIKITSPKIFNKTWASHSYLWQYKNWFGNEWTLLRFSKVHLKYRGFFTKPTCQADLSSTSNCNDS